MQDFKLLSLVVIYKKNESNSESLQSLKYQSFKNSDIFVWDNSPDRNNELAFNYKIYKHTPENVPLANIYESVIRYAQANNYSHLLILDHDSNLDSDYLQKISQLAPIHNKSVLVPNVVVNNTIVSPASNYKFFGWYCNGKPKYKYFSAINSGVCFPLSLIGDGFSYPNGIKNYGTDVFLFDFFKQNQCKFKNIDSTIMHDLTLSKTNINNDTYLKSYIAHMEAMEILYGNKGWGKVVFLFYRLFHSLLTSIKRKDFNFIWLPFNDK